MLCLYNVVCMHLLWENQLLCPSPGRTISSTVSIPLATCSSTCRAEASQCFPIHVSMSVIPVQCLSIVLRFNVVSSGSPNTVDQMLVLCILHLLPSLVSELRGILTETKPAPAPLARVDPNGCCFVDQRRYWWHSWLQSYEGSLLEDGVILLGSLWLEVHNSRLPSLTALQIKFSYWANPVDVAV